MSKWLNPKKNEVPHSIPFIGYFRIKKEYYVWPLIRDRHLKTYFSILIEDYNSESQVDYPDTLDDILDLEDRNHKLLAWMPLPTPPLNRRKK